MKYGLFLTSFLLILVTFFAFNSPLFAQTVNQFKTEIQIDLTPDNPGPNENVSATVSSFATSINEARITWVLNGKTIKSGRGEKTVSFSTGGYNTTTNLDVIVVTKEGETIEKVITIKPVQIDLIWQTDSFVPPFYKGKADFSFQNKITFIALPHLLSGGVEISPKNLVYKWTKDGEVVDTASGFGKNTYTFTQSIIARPINVDVEVSNGGKVVGIQSTTVSPNDPEVIMYEKNPIYGIEFEKALLNTVNLNGSEISVIGMPYFFGSSDLSDINLQYKWSLNGVSIDNDYTKASRVFRPKDGASGVSNISLSVENGAKILQVGEANFNLNYQKQTSDTSF
jgi:hypothetical protein